MSAAESVLEVNNIEVIYNKAVQVLRGLSLAVPRGQIVALLGSNGAGKSTTLKTVSGLLGLENGELTRGEIRFEGRPLADSKPHELVRAGLFHVMEGRRVFEDLSVEENLVAATYALTGRKGEKADKELVYEYFPRLYERRNGLAGYLSGGEQQMLAIARALMSRPQLLLLDEPSLGLAPLYIKKIFQIVRELNREHGMTILLVEQNAHHALRVAHRGYVLQHGQIILSGTGQELLANPEVHAAYLEGGQAATAS